MTEIAAVATYDSVMRGAMQENSAGSTLWYLGSNFARLRTLESRFGGGMQIASVGERVNAAAHSLLPLMLNLDSALAGENFNRSAWNASDIADRSRYNSPFFLELSRAVAVQDALKSGERIVVVADDDAMALTLFDTIVENGFETSWIGGNRQAKRLRLRTQEAVKGLRHVVGSVRNMARRLSEMRSARNRRPLDGGNIRAVDSWVVVWATERTFTPGRPLDHEERMGRLPAILRDAGLRVGYLVFPLWPEKFGLIARSALSAAEPVVFAEDAVDLPRIFSAAWRASRVARGSSPALSWSGWDLTPILTRARAHERLTGRPMQAELLRALPEFLKNAEANPNSIVTTYENHSWEKVLTEAVRQHLPQTAVVGYNHASFSSFYISLNPSDGDIAANVIPDRVLTLGPRAAEDLSARGFPKARLAVAGGLRYEQFFDEAHRIAAADVKPRLVLCCVGVDIDEGLELVHKAAEAVAGDPEFSLVVNFHPMNGPEFRGQLKSLLAACNTPHVELIRFDDRPVRELLREVETVLYIDSNAGLEAAAAGRRTIYVQRETGLDYDKMPDGLSIRCRTPQQIREALRASFDPKRASDLLRRCISPVDVRVILDAVAGRAA